METAQFIARAGPVAQGSEEPGPHAQLRPAPADGTRQVCVPGILRGKREKRPRVTPFRGCVLPLSLVNAAPTSNYQKNFHLVCLFI